MSYEKYRRLVNLLIKRTEAGTANWETTYREDMFALSLPDFTVRVIQVDNGGSIDIAFEIVNSNGSVIDRFTDTQAAGELETRTEKQDFYATARRLHDLARRHALGVDGALDSLLAELDKEQ